MANAIIHRYQNLSISGTVDNDIAVDFIQIDVASINFDTFYIDYRKNMTISSIVFYTNYYNYSTTTPTINGTRYYEIRYHEQTCASQLTAENFSSIVSNGTSNVRILSLKYPILYVSTYFASTGWFCYGGTKIGTDRITMMRKSEFPSYFTGPNDYSCNEGNGNLTLVKFYIIYYK